MEIRDVFLNCISAYLTKTAYVPPADCDWDALLQLCHEQKLIAPVYTVVRGAAANAKQWRMAALSDAAMQARRSAEFETLCAQLSERGICPLVVKGVLCRETYPEPDARISSDEDLYVPRAQYDAFHETMLALGFRSDAPDLENAHELRYTRGSLLIEGHWELFPQENTTLNALNALSDGFWARAVTRDIGGGRVRVPDATDHMTFLLLHLFKHFINSGAGVRQICDVAQWSKAYEIDWPRVREALALTHAEVFAGAVFDAGARYFGMAFPEGWPRADCAALLADALGGGIYGSATMSRKHSGSMTLAAVEDAKGAGRLKSLLRTLFPNRAVMEMSYPWVKKSAVLLAPAWVVRIARYLVSRGGGSSAAESMKIGTERIALLQQYQIL